MFGLGFADLVRGGITVSAILLAMAYCVLVPLVIWHWDGDAELEERRDERPSYLAAGIVAACVLGLYVVTLAPSTAMWDTSEYIAAAYTFGLPHPPGNPLFVIVGRVFSLLPIAPIVASRINILAALSQRGGRRLWFLVTERVLRGWFTARVAADRRRDALARADRRDGVHGVEPVGREREGVHGFARGHRDRVVAHRALVRRPRRSQGRPPTRAHRVPLRARLRQPHGGHAAAPARRPRDPRDSAAHAVARAKLLLACVGRARSSA